MKTAPALSEVSVTEFLTLRRSGFVPRGLVIGSCVYSAGSQYDWTVETGEINRLSDALRTARHSAVDRMRAQASNVGADGIVAVRLEIEHHQWRGGRQVAKCLAVGTAVSFDPACVPEGLRHAPSLRLANGSPFDSDLSAQEFVTLLAAGFRPVTVAMGTCVYGLDPRHLRDYRGYDAEIKSYARAFFDARESAMDRLQLDLFKQFPKGQKDTPLGIVGMTVSEATYGGGSSSGPPIVEFTALGTAIAALEPDDPRRRTGLPKPRVVVPLDR